MSKPETVKTWETTRVQGLVRHKSGHYYARLFLDGKDIWKSLKTKHFGVAESKFADAVKVHKKRKSLKADTSSAKMTFDQAAVLHLDKLKHKVDIKEETRIYWRKIDASLKRSWPKLGETELRKLTTTACREWAAEHSKTSSGSRYNNAIAFLRHVFEIGIEHGVIVSNPAEKMERKPIRPKQLELPTLDQFAKFISAIRNAAGRFSKHCADFAEGLAFTGCRLSEAARIELGHLNFAANEVFVQGDPDEGTKNGEVRRVPMIPRARALFERLALENSGKDRTAHVFQVRECQKAMTHAAKKVGMTRITHHDLRHFFATVCIESGVDIPTVSRWLGHKDGGVLAMKTYGHLRNEHSLKQAMKVSFEPSIAS